MTPDAHQRPPAELSKEIWFYSLERRAQSSSLRRVTVVLTVVAVLLMVASTIQVSAAAAALGAVAAVVTLELGGYVRSERQKKSILAQLADGANPQLVDAVGSALANRSIILMALVIGVAVATVAVLVIGLPA